MKASSSYMRGVCVDCANKPPGRIKLRNAKLNSVRIEMRDLPSFYEYTNHLAKGGIEQAWLVGPSTERLGTILNKTQVRPSLVIIGNEPDIIGPSSWTMDMGMYMSLWRLTAPLIRRKWPSMELSLAGMWRHEYMTEALYRANPKPTYVNLHYPDSDMQVQAWTLDPGIHLIVGEWNWREATAQEMYDWQAMLDYHTWASFWFCWGDYMVPDHGLVTKAGSKNMAYYNLREARRRLD